MEVVDRLNIETLRSEGVLEDVPVRTHRSGSVSAVELVFDSGSILRALEQSDKKASCVQRNSVAQHDTTKPLIKS